MTVQDRQEEICHLRRTLAQSERSLSMFVCGHQMATWRDESPESPRLHATAPFRDKGMSVTDAVALADFILTTTGKSAPNAVPEEAEKLKRMLNDCCICKMCAVKYEEITGERHNAAEVQHTKDVIATMVEARSSLAEACEIIAVLMSLARENGPLIGKAVGAEAFLAAHGKGRP